MSENKDEVGLTPRERGVLEQWPDATLVRFEDEAPARVSALKGVRGVLLFLAIILFASPVLTIGEFMGASASSAGSQEPAVVRFLALVCIINAASLWTAAYRLVFVRVWTTVPIVIVLMWLGGPALTLFTTIVAHAAGLPVEDLARGVVQGVIHNLVWTTYLLRSKRVRATYPRPEDVAKTFS